MGKLSRTKGATGERECVQWALPFFPDAHRTAPLQAGRPHDYPDVLAGPFAIEVKRGKTIQLWPAWEQAQAQCPDGLVPIVYARRDREPAIVIMPADVAMRMMRRYER